MPLDDADTNVENAQNISECIKTTKATKSERSMASGRHRHGKCMKEKMRI